MTKKHLEKELDGIVSEMTGWREQNKKLNKHLRGPYPEKIVRQRELVLFRRQLLCNIHDAKKQKDKKKELFSTKIYDIVTSYCGYLKTETNRNISLN